jgi:hypothetical protein
MMGPVDVEEPPIPAFAPDAVMPPVAPAPVTGVPPVDAELPPLDGDWPPPELPPDDEELPPDDATPIVAVSLSLPHPAATKSPARVSVRIGPDATPNCGEERRLCSLSASMRGL